MKWIVLKTRVASGPGILPQRNGLHGAVEWYVISVSFSNISMTDVFFEECTIDILMHLPRSVFSERQLDLLLWLLRINGIADVPSPNSIKNVQTILHTMCGVESLPYDGALGHKFYVNSLAQIIAQVRFYGFLCVLTALLGH
jgi:hypothetical protein